MFKGIGRLGMAPFSFSFSNGVVSGPSFSFDLKGFLGSATPTSKAFFCNNPGMLVQPLYDAWNSQFNPQCAVEGGGWNSGCLQLTGTPNLLSAAGVAIQSQVAEWGKSYLGSACSPPATQPPPSTTVPSGGGGGGGAPIITPSGPPIPQSSAPPDFFGGIGTIGIIAAIAVVGLLMLKR